jgi:hypothetical protein
LTVALRRNGAQRHHGLRARDHVVDLDGERSRRQFLGFGEERENFVVAVVITGERTAPRSMPVDVRVENLQDGGDVAAAEGLIAPTDEFDVFGAHFVSP